MKTWTALGWIGAFCIAILPASARELTLDQRVEAQRAIEQVYWTHRIWPKENHAPKPTLSTVMSESALRAKVDDYLRKSNALETWWHRPITGDQLQGELDRMSRSSRDPEILRELYSALGDDSFVIAETLARQSLAERLIRNWYDADDRFHGSTRSFDDWWSQERESRTPVIAGQDRIFTTTMPLGGACVDDTWELKFYAPSGRASHTAVWTGTEMIIWGGADGAYELNSGARYNPATDTWTPTSVGANVPSGRYQHTAVWTGSEMIVWGGTTYDGTTMNSGGRYDPGTDSWSPTSEAAGVPSARSAHTAVWTGTQMIVWGGYGGTYLNTGALYDPASDGWTATATASAPLGRSAHSAVWTGSLMIVWGGYNGSNQFTGGRYNPTSNTWTATAISAGIPSVRSGHTAVWTGSEMIVWGGANTSVVNTGGRYNPATNTWATMALSPLSARQAHTAVWSGSAMIVWGGLTNTSASTNTGARYTPATNSWATATSLNVPKARYGHSAIWTGSEMIVWGGYAGSGSLDEYQFSGGRYDPAANTWVRMPSVPGLPSARQQQSAVWTGAEFIVWGGYDGTAYTNTGGRYDPATDTWIATSVGANVPSARGDHAAVWTGAQMVVWGGGATNSGGRYDPASDSWTPTSTGVNVPAGRRFLTSVWTGSEMLVWGGSSGSVYMNSGGRYNPSSDSWEKISVDGNTPSARDTHTAVWTGAEMIVWGGYDGSNDLATGGRYDPVADSWTTTSSLGAPSPRSQHTAVWTGTRMIVWAGFGGGASGGRYDPSTDSWTPVGLAGSPESRRYHSAVWTGSEMIIWGGFPGGMGEYDTGGRYDPNVDAWKPTSLVNVPSKRDFHSAAWTGQKMIVWGGYPFDVNVGLYCAAVCLGPPVTYYKDIDGDGFGDPSASVQSCSPPAGYVTDGTDCNDGAPTIHPGAVENCNGFDEDCDNVADNGAQPGELTGVGSSKSGTTASFDWPAMPTAFRYDVVRGNLGGWPVGSGAESCLTDDTFGTSASDAGVPASGQGYWYLFRGENVCGNGGYGSQGSHGVPTAPRISTACP